jgi:hypothetical protein
LSNSRDAQSGRSSTLARSKAKLPLELEQVHVGELVERSPRLVIAQIAALIFSSAAQREAFGSRVTTAAFVNFFTGLS